MAYHIENLSHINKNMFLLTYLLFPLFLTSGTTQDTYNDSVTNNPIIVKVCEHKGKLSQVKIWDKNTRIKSTCNIVEMYNFRLSLRECDILRFARGWYQLTNSPVNYIDLSRNYVTEVSRILLNNLSISVNTVVLAHNQIVNLKKGIIQNKHIRRLDLDSNFISDIDEGAFRNTQLTMLTIQNNKLKNTKFAATLPTTLKTLGLEKNRMTEISDGCFSKLNKLVNLTLAYNNITVIPVRFWDGLSALENLDLSYNNIFQFDLPVLVDLINIHVLNLQFNKIENLEAGMFVKFPKMNELHLEGNYISNIENGCFNLPRLRYLYLSHNSLTRIDKDIFEGLGNLRALDLTFNRIAKIEMKSLFKSEKLNYIDISNNPVISPGGSGKWVGTFIPTKSPQESRCMVVCKSDDL